MARSFLSPYIYRTLAISDPTPDGKVAPYIYRTMSVNEDGGATVFDYEQPTDPGAVGAGKWWADTTEGSERVGRRNAANDAWVFFSNVGGGIPNYWPVASGATGDDLQDVIDGAEDGDIIVMPSGTITQTSPLYVNKPMSLIGHPDGTSKLLINANTSDNYGGGSSHQIVVGTEAGIDGVRLSGFAIEHNRVASPDMRTLAIDIAFHASNVEIDHVTFINITSDPVIVRPYPWNVDPGCDGFSLHDCLANEFWEGFFNFHSGWLRNARVYNNTGSASTIHAGYQGPMGLEVNIEQEHGACIGLEMDHNSFTLTGAASGVGGNGGALGFVENVNDVNGNVIYDKIHCHDNIFDGFYFGIYLPAVQYSNGTLPSSKSLVVIADNSVVNCGSVPLYIWPDSSEPTWRTGSPNDRIVLIRNTGNGNAPLIDQSRLSAGEINIDDIDNNWTGA